MVWPTQFLGDNIPDLPVDLEDEVVDKSTVWDVAFREGAEYLSNYLHEYLVSLTGKENVIDRNFRIRADWIDDLFKTEPVPEEEVSP